MKKRIIHLTYLIILITVTACSATAAASTEIGSVSQPVATTEANYQDADISQTTTVSVDYDPDDLETSVNTQGSTSIQLQGTSISIDGSGVDVASTVATINSAGTYSISGNLDDGQIIVDTDDIENVVLILNGADITSSTSAPLFVSNAEKTIITLAEDTENIIRDGENHVFTNGEDEPNAAVFSKDDLTINGSGSLTVYGNYFNGIASKDDLKITGGTITVFAVNDAIRGRDSVAVKDGDITLTSGGDGIQSNNDEDSSKGFVVIEGGKLQITTDLDGIQAETSLLVSGGEINIITGGGSVESGSGGGFGGRGMEGNTNQSEESIKGLKAGEDLTISGGVIQISALDDAVHSNGSILITGGELTIASGDDGIHADDSLTINGGEINITQSYEGLESIVITINGGSIHLEASDDGINASSGTGDMQMPGQGFDSFGNSDNFLYINGGYLYVDANGDGIDSNGPIEMTGGVVLVNGPTSDGNGPLDYTGHFDISGGFLVAVGSSGMAQTPSTSSTQYAVMYNFDTAQAGGTIVHIETQSGENLLTFIPTKDYQSVLLSSPDLQNGDNLVVITGGNSDGEVIDGLITSGSYTPGTEIASFTISSIITGEGTMGGGFRGSGPGRPEGGPPTRP